MRRTLIVFALALVPGLGAAAGPAPRSLAAVYWGGGAGIGAANLDGSSALVSYPYELADTIPQASVCGVAVNGTDLFWADRYNGSIGRMALSPSPAGRLEFNESVSIDQSLVSGLVEPCGVAVDSAHIYWTSSFGLAIGRANLDGSEPDPNFIAGASVPCGIAVDGSHIYWANQWGDTIGRANLDGSGVDEKFITGAEGPCGVAVDGSHLYWANELGNSIGRANLSGGEADQHFIATVAPPCGVAVNSTHLYWTNFESENGFIGRASLDGSGVVQSFVSVPHYRAACGVALDSRVFGPPPPTQSRQIRFAKLRHDLRTGAIVITVVVPARGELTVNTPGVRWSVAKGNPPAYVAGSFNWRLRVRPGGGNAAAKRIRRQLSKKGRAPLALRLTYQEEGRLPRSETKRIALIRRR